MAPPRTTPLELEPDDSRGFWYRGPIVGDCATVMICWACLLILAVFVLIVVISAGA